MHSALGIPQLPAELWKMVFGNFGTADEDLIHLWLDYRHVSKLFKNEVEHIFATNHVPKTSLWVGNGTSLYDHSVATEEISEPSEGLTHDAVFKFERFSEHGERAVFRYSLETRLSKDDLDYVFEALKHQDVLRNMLKKPFHVVQIRKQVNDTYLPDLIVDDQEQTVSLNWKQLFSLFFAEERKYYVVKPGSSDLIHENRGFRLEDWHCIDYECSPSVERMCDGCLVAITKDSTEEEEMRTRAFEIRQKRFSNRITLASCADVKRRLRRNRIQFLSRDLLHQDLVADDEFDSREKAAMQRIDDVRFLALDEDASDYEDSM